MISILTQLSGKKKLLSSLLFFILLPNLSHGELVDRVVAIVNNDVITMSEVNEIGKSFFQKLTAKVPSDKLGEAMKQGREEVLTNLIETKLISQEAEKNRIKVSDQELDAAAKNMIAKNKMSPDEFQAYLQSLGMNDKMFRDNLRHQILQSKLTRQEVHSRIVITDDQVLDYYDTHYTKHLDEGGYYLLQMGFSWGKNDGTRSQAALYADKMDAKKRAERVRSLVLNGQDFKQLAKKFSDLPSANDGGDIGAFVEDDMADYMKEVVLSLQAGQVSKLVETPAGYQFFKILSNQDGQIVFQEPYEAVEKEIRKKLYDQKAKEEFAIWIKRVRDSAYIKRM